MKVKFSLQTKNIKWMVHIFSQGGKHILSKKTFKPTHFMWIKWNDEDNDVNDDNEDDDEDDDEDEDDDGDEEDEF